MNDYKNNSEIFESVYKICEEDDMIIAIVGSSKYKDLILEVGKIFNLGGHMAIHSDVFSHADNFEISEDQVQICIKNGHDRINIADMVFVINIDKYIGDSTKEEIEYAVSNNKRVEYLVY